MKNNNRVHFYWLDLIRFLAAFLVLSGHFRGAFFVEYGLLPLEQQGVLTSFFYLVTRLGHEAVLIFFVMSGFLVGGRVIERLRDGTFDLKSYTIDRFVRIFLPLFSALLLLIPTNWILGIKMDWLAWFGNLFSLQGICCPSVIDTLWSLSYEVWFYILAGCLTLFFKKHLNGMIVPFTFLIICLSVFTKLNSVYLFIWLMGTIAYLIIPPKRNKLLLWGSLLAMCVLVAALQATRGSRSFSAGGWYSYLPNREILELLFSFTFCMFLLQVILIRPTNSCMESINNWGTKLARFSYTLYLVHMLILRLLENCGMPKSDVINLTSIGYYILELAIGMMSAYLIYWFFEKRTAAVKLWLYNISNNKIEHK